MQISFVVTVSDVVEQLPNDVNLANMTAMNPGCDSDADSTPSIVRISERG